ncbi:methylenetetrahydrofolate reductase [Pseudomonadota bacterium]|nr:methylenetetrahydrofolate reductase [Pseudomonadota bacterium]
MIDTQNFIYTAETTPDLSTNLSNSVSKIDPLVGLADAVNITDSPNCNTKLSSILSAAEIKKKGLDVILQLTGRDRNRIALESEMLGALSIDVNKVLCLTGDQPSEGGPKAVNEFNGTSLIELAMRISKGQLTDGSEIQEPKTLHPGAADDLYTHQSNPNAIVSLIKKIHMGATFVQTQYCFDVNIIKAYSDLLMNNGKDSSWQTIVGMGPLKSAKQADWMRKNLWGINISDEIIHRLDAATNPINEGIEICTEIINEIKDFEGIDGVHLMGPNCEELSAQIIKETK